MPCIFPSIDRPVSGISARILNLVIAIFIASSVVCGPCFAAAQEWRAKKFSNATIQRIREAIAIQNKHAHRLMRLPGVVGFGTGIGAEGKPVIRVFARYPQIIGIPQNLDGIAIKVNVTGIFIAYRDPTDRFERPVPIGVSSGHPDITAGTIGARVVDNEGYVYALSNNHVYANQNDASIGDSIIQPGAVDGGSDPVDKIAELFDFESINFSIFGSNTMDAAIADTTIDELGRATPPDGYGMPNSAIFGDRDADGFFDNKSDLLQLSVQKFGRTTGLTHGRITEINVLSSVCYANCADFFESKFAWFSDQIRIVGNNNDAFSAPGDSGSLVITGNPAKQPVALLFAGSESSTLANRLDLVLDRFDVSIDGAPAEDICYGDLSMDHDVDGQDVYLFTQIFPSNPDADLNNDRAVNSEDIKVLSDEFGQDKCP